MKKTFEDIDGDKMAFEAYGSLCTISSVDIDGIELEHFQTREPTTVLDISTHLIRCAHKMGATKAEIVKPIMLMLFELYPEGIDDVIEPFIVEGLIDALDLLPDEEKGDSK